MDVINTMELFSLDIIENIKISIISAPFVVYLLSKVHYFFKTSAVERKDIKARKRQRRHIRSEINSYYNK